MPRCTHPDCPTHTESPTTSTIRLQIARGEAKVALRKAEETSRRAAKEALRLTNEIARLDARLEKSRESNKGT